MTNGGDSISTTRTHGQAGFGLVELVVALAVSSIGAVALAGAGLAIGEQNRTSRWDADQGLVARSVLEEAHRLGHGRVPTGATSVSTGARAYTVQRLVAPATGRLDAVAVEIRRPGHPAVRYETRIAAARPLPGAP